MSDLTDFLLARIAEDEAVAREVLAAIAPDKNGWTNYYEDAKGSAPSVYWDVDYAQGGFTITAARVLAECEAKRRIVEAARDYSPELEHGDNGEWAFDTVLRLLAQPYADHPDFREEWRV